MALTKIRYLEVQEDREQRSLFRRALEDVYGVAGNFTQDSSGYFYDAAVEAMYSGWKFVREWDRSVATVTVNKPILGYVLKNSDRHGNEVTSFSSVPARDHVPVQEAA